MINLVNVAPIFITCDIYSPQIGLWNAAITTKKLELQKSSFQGGCVNWLWVAVFCINGLQFAKSLRYDTQRQVWILIAQMYGNPFSSTQERNLFMCCLNNYLYLRTSSTHMYEYRETTFMSFFLLSKRVYEYFGC